MTEHLVPVPGPGTDTAVAPGWTPPGDAYVEGRWIHCASRLEVIDPEDGRSIGRVGDADAHLVAHAVGHLARSRDRAGDWPLWRRREAVAHAAGLVAERAETFARVLSAESSKTLAEARSEVARAVETLRLSAEAASTLEGRTVPFANSPRGDGWTGWWTREPVGVVAAITPYNDPLNLVAHKLGPALVAGNGVVLKPSELTPLSAYALVEVLLEAGVPGSHLAVLAGSEAGPALVADDRVDLVSFTGGPTTARRIAAGGRARKLLMELGGNNALVVCADADPVEVAEAIVDGAFGVAGQNCLSVQRVLVAAPLMDRVLAEVVAATDRLVVGTKSAPETDIGPMISVDAARAVTTTVTAAVADGAVLHTGGARWGAFVDPAVLTGVPHTSALWREEVFGPVVLLEPWDDVDAVVDAANDTDTGLQAGVWTSDVHLALDLADRLRVGAVLIGSTSDFRIDAMPFGGFKGSGIGREGVASALESLTEPKVVAVRRRASH